jgi:hypothetical protein
MPNFKSISQVIKQLVADMKTLQHPESDQSLTGILGIGEGCRLPCSSCSHFKRILNFILRAAAPILKGYSISSRREAASILKHFSISFIGAATPVLKGFSMSPNGVARPILKGYSNVRPPHC